VNSLPAVSLALPTDMCINNTLNLVGGNPSGGTYSGPHVNSGVFDPTGTVSGTYQITYSYTDGNNCTNSTTKSILVRDIPINNLGPDTTVCTGSILTLDAGSGFSTYHWSNGANTQIIQVSLINPGTINCVSTVTDYFNCSASDALLITFDICSKVDAINSDYPWCYIYPNPFKNGFTLFSEKKLHIRIYDISGRLIEQHYCEGSMVAGQNLTSGIYFVDAIYNNQRKTYKVIKAE
jgi:hypothetical protein